MLLEVSGFSKRFGGLGSHTVKIRVSATPGHPRVDLDAFVYLD